MSKRYLISTKKAVSRKAVESVLHDEMTETIYPLPLTSFAANNFAEEVQVIPVMEEGSIAIERVFVFPLYHLLDQSSLVPCPFSQRSESNYQYFP